MSKNRPAKGSTSGRGLGKAAPPVGRPTPGARPSKAVDCGKCRGSGRLLPLGGQLLGAKCDFCKGKGWLV